MRNPPLMLVGNVKLEVQRSTPETLDRGRWIAGEPEIVPVIANVQPVLKSTDTLLLPEGDRSKAVLKVYTKGQELRQRREGSEGWPADRFYWKGDLYEVMKVISYDMGVMNHYKALCSRVEVT